MDDDIGHVHITVTVKGHVPRNSRLELINLTPAGTAIVIETACCAASLIQRPLSIKRISKLYEEV